MANIKPEDTDNSIWQGYGLHPPTSTSSHIQNYDANFHPAPLSIPYHGRPQKSQYRSMDIPALQTRPRPPTRDDNTALTASPPTLNSHHSYPSLKRAFDGGNEMGYMESVQDYREDLPEMQKPTINQDHRLLNFGRLPDKHTLLDSQGRVKQVDLTAQIHGMFFLSELATPSGENILTQPELTCYRRNLFQISGNVTAPRGAMTLITERGERIPIMSLEVSISATESVDGHIVKLIVIPWKTPPPNSPEIPAGQEHEPTPIPLVAFEEGAEANSEFTVFPIAYRRLQFRIATANNGRRRELQQHFTLHLNVVATLANGAKVNVSENSTAPIVVRGRSPRNFQARKEIPLVGSSSSRGHPPELHVTTQGMGQSPVAPRRGSILKPGTVELPRSPYAFDSSTLSGSPSVVRQSTYPQWSNTQQTHHTPLTPDQHPTTSTPQTPSSSYPSSAISLDTYLQPTHISSPHRSATMPMPIPNRSSQYTFPTPVPQYQDNNPRPAKSPRHQAPPELPSIYSSSNSDYRYNTPYTSGGGLPPLASTITTTGGGTEYFPAPPPISMPMPMPMSMSMALPPAWSSAPVPGNDGGGYGGVLPGIVGGQQQSWDHGGQNQVQNQQGRDEGSNAAQGHYTWNHS